MRILLVGAGGVGAAFVSIARRRHFFEACLVTDYDEARAEKAVVEAADGRFTAARIDASSAESVATVAREFGATHVMNAVDPRFVMPIFEGAFAVGADYLDMAMSLSRPHLERPYEECGLKLGDEQFARAADWEQAGRLALVGMGVEPGLSDGFAPTTSSTRSTSSALATAPTSPSTGTTSRPPSRSGPRSRSA